MRPLIVLALLLSSACSALIRPDGEQRIICHATKEPIQCAPEGDVPRALQVFSEFVMPLDEGFPLIVHWYDWDHAFDIDNTDFKEVTGYTDLNKWPYEVHVRNGGVLMHELTHVALEESAGDPDQNHSEAPGPWGRAHDVAIEEAKKAFGVTNGTPCPPEVCDEDQ